MKKFIKVPQEKWTFPPKGLIEVWSNPDFLVQINQEKFNKRITINKTTAIFIKGNPHWKDGITWDQIQEIKQLVGYGDHWAVECYPPDHHVINIANMRHIWILENPPEFGWHKNDN
jgi:hypothetical protein